MNVSLFFNGPCPCDTCPKADICAKGRACPDFHAFVSRGVNVLRDRNASKGMWRAIFSPMGQVEQYRQGVWAGMVGFQKQKGQWFLTGYDDGQAWRQSGFRDGIKQYVYDVQRIARTTLTELENGDARDPRGGARKRPRNLKDRPVEDSPVGVSEGVEVAA